MKLNKRIFASAALSVSLVAPAVAPVALADEAPTHTKCEQRFQKGADFNGTPEIIVAAHLNKNCGLSPEEIGKLSPEEVKTVAKELKDSKGRPALTEAQINNVKQPNSFVVKPYLDGLANKPKKEQGSDEQSVEKKTSILANDIAAGEREVTGQAFVVGADKQSVKAIFPGGKEATVELGDGIVLEEGLRLVEFTIAVPEGVELKADDQVSFVTVPSNGKSTTIMVGAAEEADSNEESAPDDAVGSSKIGKVFGVIAGLGGLAALVAGATHWLNQNQDFAHFLQPLRDFLAQFNIKF